MNFRSPKDTFQLMFALQAGAGGAARLVLVFKSFLGGVRPNFILTYTFFYAFHVHALTGALYQSSFFNISDHLPRD